MLEIVIDFVIEIALEQTWLFQCTLFHYADKSAEPKPYSGTTYADFNRDFNQEFSHDFKRI